MKFVVSRPSQIAFSSSKLDNRVCFIKILRAVFKIDKIYKYIGKYLTFRKIPSLLCLRSRNKKNSHLGQILKKKMKKQFRDISSIKVCSKI